MTQSQITERQQYWRDHVLAATAYEGSIVEYDAANNLKTKDLYQWKTALTKRGFLNKASGEQSTTEFAEIKISSSSVAEPARNAVTAHCRLTLFCVGVF